jgi:hypothetical protein
LLGGKATLHQGEIVPSEGAVAQLVGEMAMTAVVLGDEQETRGVFVQPVNNAGARFAAHPGEGLAVV